MASASTKAASTKSILKPKTTLKGHRNWIHAISYFPDGQRMISGSRDKTARQWDLKEGKDIEGARDAFEETVYAVAVSRDGRWVVTGSGDGRPKVKAFEVETGIVKVFEGHSGAIFNIDISADNTLLATSGSFDGTARIWNLETGTLVAGPFKSIGYVTAVRFSPDSKKLAVGINVGTCLNVWDVESQKLDATIGNPNYDGGISPLPIFWTNKNKTIVAVFNESLDDNAKTIFEFDAVTLKTVGAPFDGHTNEITGLALSFDGALLASASQFEATIKLWAFESRQLLASFDVQNVFTLILSPDSCQLAYTTYTEDDDDCKIYICDIPPDILTQAIARKKSALRDILNSDATRRPPAGHRPPPISAIPMAPRPQSTRDPQQPTFLRLGKFLRFSRTNGACPGQKHQSRDPLDFPATLPLPSNRIHGESASSTLLSSGRAFFNPSQSSPDEGKQKACEPKRKTVKVVDVPVGQATYGDVVGVDDGRRPFVLFFCLSWFQKKEKKPEPRPVYDDEFEDDEEEENALDQIVLPPPRVQHEEIELKTINSQSQAEAGPSRLEVTNHLEAQSS